MLSYSKEDYLKTIYNLSIGDEKRVSTAKLAERLKITNAATSDMVKRLDKQGFVKYKKYNGVELTKDGLKIALEMIRRHRLWESFLTRTLKLSWSEVHEEAEILEHNSSDFLVDKIDAFLDFPKFDPHGAPIPAKDGFMPDSSHLLCLAEADIGKDYIVERVSHENKEVMEYFSKIGIGLYSVIQIEDKFEFDGSLFVRINNSQHTLSTKVAESLYVSLKIETE